MSDGELYLKLDLPVVPQPGQLVVVDNADKPLAIATVIGRVGNNPPRFDVMLVDGCRAVASWMPAGPNRGYWHALGKGPAPAT